MIIITAPVPAGSSCVALYKNRICKHIQPFSSGLPGAVAITKALNVDVRKANSQVSNNLIMVTLAEKWSGSDPTGMYMSEKYDGMRCLWTGDALVSRNNNPVNAPPELIRQLPDKIALDGELYLGRNRFQETMRIVRRASGTVSDWSEVKYMIF